MSPHQVFIAGATGYMGRHLIPELLQRGHHVRALVRAGSEGKLRPGCELVEGNALDRTTFAHRIAPCDTFVHMIGVPHPSPAKAKQFLEIDLVAARESIAAAAAAGIRQFVYVSVGQPAPVMKAFVQSRAEAEALIARTGLNATIIRPWYVLGPGHRWAYALVPIYWVLERLPSTRDRARRLGLITLPQMIRALVHAIEHPADGTRVVDVPNIRAGRF